MTAAGLTNVHSGSTPHHHCVCSNLRCIQPTGVLINNLKYCSFFFLWTYMLPSYPSILALTLAVHSLFVLCFLFNLSIALSVLRSPASLSCLKAMASHRPGPMLLAATDPLCHLYHRLLHRGLLNHSANCRSCGSLWLCSALSREMRINTDTR